MTEIAVLRPYCLIVRWKKVPSPMPSWMFDSMSNSVIGSYQNTRGDPMLYQIVPGCKTNQGQMLLLSINKDGSIEAGVDRGAGGECSKDQLWQCIQAPNANGAIVFVSQSFYDSNPPKFRVLRANGNRTNVDSVEISSVAQITDHMAWTLSGDPGEHPAIRALYSDNQNLNVRGNEYHNGNEVATWEWSGGAPNERWTLRPVGLIP
ncbi:MAG: hypothetical protein IPO40_18295 [Fibrobacteres bacterium]|nr:hypothetical protein [Fibrobacterota bacterium]